MAAMLLQPQPEAGPSRSPPRRSPTPSPLPSVIPLVNPEVLSETPNGDVDMENGETKEYLAGSMRPKSALVNGITDTISTMLPDPSPDPPLIPTVPVDKTTPPDNAAVFPHAPFEEPVLAATGVISIFPTEASEAGPSQPPRKKKRGAPSRAMSTDPASAKKVRPKHLRDRRGRRSDDSVRDMLRMAACFMFRIRGRRVGAGYLLL